MSPYANGPAIVELRMFNSSVSALNNAVVSKYEKLFRKIMPQYGFDMNNNLQYKRNYKVKTHWNPKSTSHK